MDYFIITESSDNALCLICIETIAVLKQYNIRRHYKMKHSSYHSQFTGKLHSDKFETLKNKLSPQQSVFRKQIVYFSKMKYGKSSYKSALSDEHWQSLLMIRSTNCEPQLVQFHKRCTSFMLLVTAKMSNVHLTYFQYVLLLEINERCCIMIVYADLLNSPQHIQPMKPKNI